ncbi:7650_t:CDS:2 [Acaulospora morrowiae]|uniref:7650_t:CDS:1 n=1 Tax=Acaulospora morrowiae TaxID=94023 RepID=A0A9N9ECR8_9GLOM|nr:7650_t:CDS:2 [Acaulospora morrowiae]
MDFAFEKEKLNIAGRDSQESRKILITGGAGFIGSHVAKYLYDRGNYVRVIDILPNTTGPFGDPKNYCSEFLTGDLRDLSACRYAVRDVQWVFHFAASENRTGLIYEKSDFTLYNENHLITVNITQAAIEREVEQFFYASSARVYPIYTGEYNRKLKESDVWQCTNGDHHVDPQCLYGCEKLNSEIFLEKFVKGKNLNKIPTEIKIGRLYNIFGEGDDWNGEMVETPSTLIHKAIHLTTESENNDKMEIWGSGNQLLSFLYIEDCVDAIIKLMESNYSKTLNIGSEEALTIEELAYIAIDTVGVRRDRVKLIVNEKVSVGVGNQSSDNSLIKKVLGWSQQTSIRKGMERTSTWMQTKIRKGSMQKNSFAEKLHQDEIRLLSKGIKFGLLLPITSRGLKNPEDCLTHLHNFTRSLYETTQADVAGMNGIKFSFKIFVGIDSDDALFYPIKNNIVESILKVHGIIDIETREFDFPPGSICKIWNYLAKDAYNQQCEYIVLFGDDIIIENANWMSKIHNNFVKISEEKKVPRGFGCVAFTEATFPGFPTFPVMSKLHIDIFHGNPFPDMLTNQDADVFLFQLYRRWGCSIMLNNVKLRNLIGGSKKGRYERIFHDWSFSVLDDAVLEVEKWMHENLENVVPRMLTLDIIVPSYHVQMLYLEPIINLKKSDTVSTMTIIIVDDPNSPQIADLKKYEYNAFIRIRGTKGNVGLSESRNQGMSESTADYILFLNDDVIPDPDILIEAEKVIRKFPMTCGFVGNVKFPESNQSIFKNAVKMSGIPCFLNISRDIDKDVPWGVTDNLIIRRLKDNIAFNHGFSKVGCVEDIDYCLRKKRFFTQNVNNGEGFRSASTVQVTRQWWNNGKRSYLQFAKLSYGDGQLIKIYPEYAYRDVPNSAELLLLLLLLLILLLPETLMFSIRTLNMATLTVLFSIPLIFIVNILDEINFQIVREPGNHVTDLHGFSRILAASESSTVRMFSEIGRLFGQICRNEWNYITYRFDWFANQFSDEKRNYERQRSREKFWTWVMLSTLIAYWVINVF